MTKGLLATLLFSCILFAGCDKLMKATDPWANCWKVTSIEASDSLVLDTVLDVVKYRMGEGYLRLYKDGAYVALSKQGSSQGAWQLNEGDKKLILTQFTQGLPAAFEVISNEKGWLSLRPISTGTIKAKEPTSVLLKADPYFEHGKVDLMQPALNTWRLKPKHAEGKEEIRKKVAAHIDYLIAYFQLTEDNEQGFFETWQLQTPYRFFSNGMAIESLDAEEPQHWREWFYNEADAAQGHKLMSEALASINKYPSGTKTFTEGYILALREMKEFIDRKK